ncbi:hypothetical protein AB3466_06765 [Sphingobacterium thalpophilum]|nr:hypothetical protein [Sphingobacterium thalpophilum]
MESTNDQILNGMEVALDRTQLLCWAQLLPFLTEEVSNGDRCPIFTI